MDPTILAIVAVLILFAGMYVAMPEGLEGFNQGSQLDGMPREGNGLIGRLADSLAEMTWQPEQLFVMLIVFMLCSIGLGAYWKSFQD